MTPPSTAAAAKGSLRTAYLELRRALAPAQVAASSQAICSRLCGLALYQQTGLLHTYVSSKGNEVDTQELIRTSLESGKRVCVPVVRPGTRRLAHAEVRDLAQLRPGRWGLYQPAEGHGEWLADLDAIDLVIVPGLAFDPLGHRLGLGGGYYDRFLARVRAPKIGLTYQELVLPEIPHETHDMLVDIVVTENQVYRCKGGEP
jgi:5-formyltetrahydrofolate cyclo-ligase